MAYATVAGLPLAVGLYTSLVPMLLYALLGTSKVLNVSSTSTIAILTGTQLGLVVADADAARLVASLATLSALVGLLLLGASLLRLGFVANFVSAPVLTGFKAGIGLVIVLDQVPKLLGVHISKAGFFRDLVVIARELPSTSLVTLLVASVSIAALVVMERLRPHSAAPLVVVAGAIVASWLVGLEARGVSTVGSIPQGLPALTLPDLALVEQLLPGALGIALMSFTETIAAGRAFANREDPPLRPNRELIATGVANLGGALIGAMPAGGGTSQTAVVRAAGGHSQLASLMTAAASALTMLFLAPLLGLLPHATLAAVVIVYSIGLIQPAEFRAIRRVRTMEFRWAVAACAGVLLFGTLKGILVAIVMSLIGLSSRAANPVVHAMGRKRGTDVLRPVSPEHPDDELFEGLLVARPEGSIFFANAQAVSDQVVALIQRYQPRVVVLDMSRVPDLEYSALQQLMAADQRAAALGIEWWLTGLNPAVLEVVRRSGLADRLGRERMLFNARAAIRRYLRENGRETALSSAPERT